MNQWSFNSSSCTISFCRIDLSWSSLASVPNSSSSSLDSNLGHHKVGQNLTSVYFQRNQNYISLHQAASFAKTYAYNVEIHHLEFLTIFQHLQQVTIFNGNIFTSTFKPCHTWTLIIILILIMKSNANNTLKLSVSTIVNSIFCTTSST